jgi:RNA polymerase sigma-70 factor (ECF subfamily)
MPTPKPVKADRSWNISVAYNGMIGQQNKYIADATIGNGSFDAGSNTMIPNDYAYSNWIGYNAYLNNIPYGLKDAETRSLMDIAAQNTGVNNGDMHVFYKHQLPITIQLSLSREFSRRLSLETGLSYTQLRSTFNTGSSLAYIQERQRIHYLGIPLRFGWRWYSTAHLSLYSSAGAMLELPIYANTEIRHINNGQNAFQKDESLNVPCQFSTTLGIGLQYDFTPHLGIYLEPNLQYFFNDGSDIKTYRSEHPLQITLPIGLRFHW